MRWTAFAFTLLLLPGLLTGQTPPSPPPDATRAIQEAMQKVETGDLAGAIQGLEAAAVPGVTPQVTALLGTLYVEAGRYDDAARVLQPLADRDGADSAEPAVLYNAGRAALAQGRLREARSYLERSLAKEPSSPAVRELGLVLSRQGQVVDAYKLLRRWGLLNPRDQEVRLVAASLALRLERPAEAEEMLAGFSETDPTVRLVRGHALIQKGDGRAALEMLAPLREQHPPGMDLEVRRALAEAHLLTGEPAKAVELLAGRAITPALLVILGRAQRQAGDLKGAAATLKPLADQLPGFPEGVGDPRTPAGVALEYGLVLKASGDTAGAVAMLERSTHFQPTSIAAWEALGEAFAAAGRADDASAARSRARDLTASRQAAAKQAAEAQAAPARQPAEPAAAPSGPAAEAQRLLAAGKPEEALAAARQGIAANPKDLELRAAEVRSLLLLKRWQDALQAAEAAVQAEPADADAVYLRGAARMALHDRKSAEQDLRRALELAPQHIAALNDLGVLLSLQGKKDEAKKLFQKVLEIQPGNPVATASLQQLE